MARIADRNGWIAPADPRDPWIRQTSPGWFDMRFERVIARPPEKVWAALTTPERIADWLGKPVQVDLRTGGLYLFYFNEATDDLGGGLIRACEPPRLLSFELNGTGGDSLITWELTPTDGGCWLVFTQSGLNAWWLLGGAAGWSLMTEEVAAIAEDRPIATDEGYSARLARYRRELGPVVPGFDIRPALRHHEAAPLVTPAAGGGYDVRFTRRWMLPIDKVWAALTEPSRLADWLAVAKIDLRVGGAVKLDWPTAGVAERHVILELDPPRRMVWGSTDPANPGVVRWELYQEDPESMGTRLTLTQTIIPPAHLLSIATGWHAHLHELPEAALRNPPLAWTAERERLRANREMAELAPRYRARLPADAARGA